MKPGDKVEVIRVGDPWFGCTGTIVSVVMNEDKATTIFRVNNISQHSLPHAIGIWDVSALKTLEIT
jgi:hypothetical protein